MKIKEKENNMGCSLIPLPACAVLFHRRFLNSWGCASAWISALLPNLDILVFV